MESVSIKPMLFDLLRQARADQQAWLADLTEAERQASGTLKQWVAKDTLGHMAFWVQRAADRLACAARNEEPPRDDDFLRTNDEVFTAQRDRAWAEVLADSERAYAGLAAQIQNMDEVTLTDPQRFAWQNDRALYSVVVGNGYAHPISHLAQFYFERGEVTRANQLQEATTARLLEVPDWGPVARYNLACYYATTGQKAKALPELRESLQLNPKLIEWSKQDSDLDSLRDDPAYQALYP